MERKINSTFKYKGKTYIVKAQPHCDNCAFDSICNSETIHITGNCSSFTRSDYTEVSFIELPKEEETMETVKISKKNILKATKENPCAEKVLKDLFPKVFEEEDKPFCKIGSIFERTLYPGNIFTIFKWNGQVRILNITYNHMWNLNLNVSELKDPNGKTLTISEFKKLVGSTNISDFNFDVKVVKK